MAMMRENGIELSNGVTMPAIGMGTFSFHSDREITKLAVRNALKMGYRHFDTAKIYGSEAAVGSGLTEAIADGSVKREDVFVTSKLWCSDHHHPVSALNQTLKDLGMEYVDVYLVHWPVKLKPWACYPVPKEEDFDDFDLETTWAGMEKCLELGLCTSIGVSNFSTLKIQRLLEISSVPPVVNQVEMHPMWRQSKLRAFCEEQKIHVSAYSPIGGPGNSWGSTAVIENPVIHSIALKHNATPAQVALKWGLSKGASVIVKSFNEERMKENLASSNVILDDEDLTQIETLEERKIMRGDVYVNETTSPYKTIQDLWDYEI